MDIRICWVVISISVLTIIPVMIMVYAQVGGNGVLIHIRTDNETSWKGDYRSGPGIQPILYT